ncbi:MAG: DinB family protein [Gemmatimonadota bacterium]
MTAGLIAELEQESAATRLMLERVPAGRLEWRPHAKSLTLGQLALHVAQVPGGVAEALARDEVEAPDFDEFPTPASREEILEAYAESLEKAKQILSELDDASLTGEWRMVREGETLLEMPRLASVRAILLNHWYHHRGQLSVYLRLLDVALPSVYGPTADENPFG